METTTEGRFNLLRRYAHELKSQLKTYSGEAVSKGSDVENKYKVYMKLRKLMKLHDTEGIGINDKHVIKKVEDYYALLRTKLVKMQTKVRQQKEMEKELQREAQREVIAEQRQLRELEEEKEKLKEKPKANGAKTARTSSHSVSDEDDDDDDDEEDEITEIGPTPQLNGRVLSIFDIETSPNTVSPVKRRSDDVTALNNLELKLGFSNNDHANDIVFKTPTRPASARRLNFGSTTTTAETEIGKSSRKLNFDVIQEDPINVTPVKDAAAFISPGIEETPMYLRKESKTINYLDDIIVGFDWSEDELDENGRIILSDDDAEAEADDDDDDVVEVNVLESLMDLNETSANTEPSPIIRKVGRSIFEMRQDLVGLKRNLTDLGKFLDLEELKSEKTDNFDNEENNDNDKTAIQPSRVDSETEHTDTEKDPDLDHVFDPHKKLRDKVKTIKRSTRRARIRTERVDSADVLDEMDIHALAFGQSFVSKPLQPTTQKQKSHQQQDQYEEKERDIGDEYEYGEEEEVYHRTDISTLQKELEGDHGKGRKRGPGKHPLSNNFVRMKIHHKRGGGGRFKRRR
jgi:DNA replication regulator SLD2